MTLGPTKDKGEFKWKSVYHTYFRLNNCIIKTKSDDTDSNNGGKTKFGYTIELDDHAIQKLLEIENTIRDQLSKENCYLKSALKRDKTLTFNLWLIRNQIKTDIINEKHDKTDFSYLKQNQVADIEFRLDNLWAHRNYYPNFIYKLKPLLIKVN